MKKLILLSLPLALAISFVNASGCFGDPLYEVNQPAIVKQGVNVRTVPCMMGSEVIRVARTNEKVRIVTKDDARWYKVVLSDGTVGWIAQQFLTTTNDWSNVPAYPQNHVPKSYCDTTNPAKCPASPVGPGVMPTWTYNNQVNYSSSQPEPQQEEPKQSQASTQNSLEKYKPMLDSLSDQIVKKVEVKYSNISDQITKLEQINKMVDLMIMKTPQHKDIFAYLQNKIEEVLTVKRLNNLLDF